MTALGKTHEQLKREEIVKKYDMPLSVEEIKALNPSALKYCNQQREIFQMLLDLFDETYKAAEEARTRLSTVGMELSTARHAIREREKEIQQLKIAQDQKIADNTELLRRNSEQLADMNGWSARVLEAEERAFKIRKKLRKLLKKRGKK
jgi:hypothetical protein